MTELDPVLARVLDRLSPAEPAAPDWPDVLARARGRRRLAWRGGAVAALAAVVVVLAAPALGLETPLGSLLGLGKRPRIEFAAKLAPVTGSASGTFVARPANAFFHVGPRRSRPFFAQRIDFVLTYHGLSGRATEARLRVAPPLRGKGTGYVVTLCKPCSSPVRGVLRRRGLLLALIARSSIEVATAAHPDGELTGRVLPRR